MEKKGQNEEMIQTCNAAGRCEVLSVKKQNVMLIPDKYYHDQN